MLLEDTEHFRIMREAVMDRHGFVDGDARRIAGRPRSAPGPGPVRTSTRRAQAGWR